MLVSSSFLDQNISWDTPIWGKVVLLTLLVFIPNASLKIVIRMASFFVPKF